MYINMYVYVWSHAASPSLCNKCHDAHRNETACQAEYVLENIWMHNIWWGTEHCSTICSKGPAQRLPIDEILCLP